MIPSTIAALQFSLEIVIGMSSLADCQAFNEGFWISSTVPCICVQIFHISYKDQNLYGKIKAISSIS